MKQRLKHCLSALTLCSLLIGTPVLAKDIDPKHPIATTAATAEITNAASASRPELAPAVGIKKKEKQPLKLASLGSPKIHAQAPIGGSPGGGAAGVTVPSVLTHAGLIPVLNPPLGDPATEDLTQIYAQTRPRHRN
jgi:hypothetical protein